MLKLSWNVREVTWPNRMTRAVRAFARNGPLVWLDASATGATGTGWSMVAIEPLATIAQPEIGPTELRGPAALLADTPIHNPWDAWRTVHNRLKRYPPAPLPLGPGWCGYVGFELGRWLERLPARRRLALPLPLLRMQLFDRAVVLSATERRAWAVEADGLRELIASDEYGTARAAADAGRNNADVAGAGARFDAYAARWDDAVRAADADGFDHSDESAASERAWPTASEITRPAERESAWSFAMQRDQYAAMIERAREYIAAGDIYQVNLAQRIDLRGAFDAWGLYQNLRRANPAAYAALLHDPSGSVLSVSPELFLQVAPDGGVLTRPIKGTRPRSGDATRDHIAEAELLASPKDAAELAMIVDLHRNDLGRVCTYGSVRVAYPRRVEAHPTVLHTVADVVGKLRPQTDALDALRAMFPAGSITGVPKIRAQEIIDELEPAARGAYTGAVGLLGLDGGAIFNVAIRTLQLLRDRAVVFSGGGIVTDSDPDAEYAETLDKARGIMRAVGVELPRGMEVAAGGGGA